MPHPSREIHLAARPQGEPKETDFRIVEVQLPDPGPGEVLVRNTWMSVDPYMRGRMSDARSYVPPFRLDAPLDGGAVGEVELVGEGVDGLATGDTVLHSLGWRERAIVPADQARKVDTSAAPPQAYLSVLGMTGLTAYVGLLDVAGLRDGDAVFVSAAAGAVGSMAAQIAKLRGHTVVGSAGGPEKVRFLKEELGLDAAIDYRSGDIRRLLREAAPDGIDVYFDNVGGDHLEAALAAFRLRGRVAMCGAISAYNAPEPPPGPRNLFLAVGKRLTLRGFIVSDHQERFSDFVREVGGWLRDGRIHHRETVVEGIENAPRAFIGMLRGENVGKMLVKLA
jgi:NADPH-dependent curcumin reductase CurA